MFILRFPRATLRLIDKIKSFVWDAPPSVKTRQFPLSPVPPQERLAVDLAHAPDHPVRDMEEGDIVWSDTPRYPAYDHGFPSSDPSRLLEQHGKLLDRLARASTFDGQRSVDAIRSLVQNYASYVNCLPATYQENHYGAGGLLKLGLDVGFFALQAANGVIFSNDSADRRTLAEPRWRLAAFIAGMACELNRTISHILVTNSDGTQWHPFVAPLSAWLKETNSSRFWVVWLKPTEAVNQKALVSFILPKIIPDEVVNYLGEDRRVLMLMNAAITGGVRAGEDNPIQLLVEKVRYKVVTSDMAKNANHISRPQIGSHLEPHIVDSMRSLYKTGVWLANDKNSRVWITKEGAFLIWKTGCADLVTRLRRNSTPGMPQDIETIYDIMLSVKLIELAPDKSRYWKITIKDGKTQVDAVKIAKPELIFDNYAEIVASADFDLLEAAPSAAKPIVAGKVDGKASKNTDPITAAGPSVATKPVSTDRAPKKPRAENGSSPNVDIGGTGANLAEGDVVATKESRVLARLPSPVAAVLRTLGRQFANKEFELYQMDGAVGIPIAMIEEKVTGVPKMAIFTALSKEKIMFVPEGQAKKIIEVINPDGGEVQQYLGICQIYVKELFNISK